MNAEQRAALRKLAEEATPGPWYSGSDYVTADLTFESVLLQLNSTGSAADGFDLGYIAAANPSTILAMLDYIETLEKDAARYRYLRDDGEGFDISVLERDTEDGELWVHGYPPEELDAALDAAMQGETE